MSVMRNKNCLELKWGALKGYYNIEKPELHDALQKYYDLGVQFSVMTQKMTPEHKAALCEACDHADEIWLSWDDKKVNAEEAKKYIMEYGL